MSDSVGYGSLGGEANTTPVMATKSTSLKAVPPGFDLGSVRCAVEQRLDELIRKDKDLFDRIKEQSKDQVHAHAQHRLHLLKHGYRVDSALTPKLTRLGAVLTKALRLVRPLDIFVKASYEHNAYCLPSRNGNRLVMCLNSGLISSMNSRELLFVMGHEIGHAVLKHGEMVGIDFDNPHFSPLEVVKIKALGRAYEISCDRFGLLACQDIRVASTALFKVASGLSERWISFDETAYSRHFDEISSMSELIDIKDASLSHPLTPLRVKALIAFSQSEAYAKALGKTRWSTPTTEMERQIETMLSVLDPDLTELEGKDEKEAANRFLFDGALLVIGADGVVEPEEVAWLQERTSEKWSGESLARKLSDSEFTRQLHQRLESNASILRNKLSEMGRAHLLHVMCEVALSAGGLPATEFDVLNQLRQLLDISVEMAQAVLGSAKEDSPGESEGISDDQSATSTSPSTDPLETILQQANLPQKSFVATKEICDEIRSLNMPLVIGVRSLVSWAICASRQGGFLTEAQGKKLVITAIRVCREIQDQAGITCKAKSNPMDKLVRKYGVIAMYGRSETVYLGTEDRPYIILSVSRAKKSVVVAPINNVQATTEVDAREVRKDPVKGNWPDELTDL